MRDFGLKNICTSVTFGQIRSSFLEEKKIKPVFFSDVRFSEDDFCLFFSKRSNFWLFSENGHRFVGGPTGLQMICISLMVLKKYLRLKAHHRPTLRLTEPFRARESNPSMKSE